MAKGSSGFVMGIVGGSVLVVVGLVVMRFMPAPQESVSSAREQLLRELNTPPDAIDRALPESLRKQDCDIASRLTQSLAGTVRPPVDADGSKGPYDYQTEELRIDAALSASSCRRLGTLRDVSTEDVLSLGVAKRLSLRALKSGNSDAARGWSVRLMALGQDLQAIAPEHHGVAGAKLVGHGAVGLIEVVVRPDCDVEAAAEALVLIGTLDGTAPTGPWLADRVATDTMRRALADPSVLKLSAIELRGLVTEAATWWTRVGVAMDEPGAPLPPPPTAEREREQLVLALLTGGDMQALATEHRRAQALRTAALALTAARVRTPQGAQCGSPWGAKVPRDPLSGAPMSWNADTCTLSLNDASWTLPALATPQ